MSFRPSLRSRLVWADRVVVEEHILEGRPDWAALQKLLVGWHPQLYGEDFVIVARGKREKKNNINNNNNNRAFADEVPRRIYVSQQVERTNGSSTATRPGPLCSTLTAEVRRSICSSSDWIRSARSSKSSSAPAGTWSDASTIWPSSSSCRWPRLREPSHWLLHHDDSVLFVLFCLFVFFCFSNRINSLITTDYVLGLNPFKNSSTADRDFVFRHKNLHFGRFLPSFVFFWFQHLGMFSEAANVRFAAKGRRHFFDLFCIVSTLTFLFFLVFLGFASFFI